MCVESGARVRGPGRASSKLRKVVRRAGAGRPQCRVVDLQVAGDTAPQELQRISAEARESVQFELYEYGAARLLDGGREPLSDDAHRPAVAIVLDPDHGLERLAVDQRVV